MSRVVSGHVDVTGCSLHAQNTFFPGHTQPMAMPAGEPEPGHSCPLWDSSNFTVGAPPPARRGLLRAARPKPLTIQSSSLPLSLHRTRRCSPNMGLKLTAPRSRVACATHSASQAPLYCHSLSFFIVLEFTLLDISVAPVVGRIMPPPLPKCPSRNPRNL